MGEWAVRGSARTDGSSGAASRATADALLALARAHPEHAWSRSADIATARNAHSTNTVEELSSALRSDRTWLEGDVRSEAGTAVMRHDQHGEHELELADWLRVVEASGRGAKVELKSPELLGEVLRQLEGSDIPQHRMILNIPILPAEALRSIRRSLPHAMVNIDPPARDGSPALTPADLVRMRFAAQVLGGPVMFPIRQDLLTSAVVDVLGGAGRIAVWNSTSITDGGPEDIDDLRELGVDGMIDLRPSVGAAQQIRSTLLETTASVLGWERVHSTLHWLGSLDAPDPWPFG